MCHYQNIHTAYHYTLLSVDVGERDAHACGREYPPCEADRGSGRVKCPLHSCCRLESVLVAWCEGAVGDLAEGRPAAGAGFGCGGICPRAFVEDVFVPFLDGEVRGLFGEGCDEDEGEAGGKSEARAERGVGADGACEGKACGARADACGDVVPEGELTMEFWPDDCPRLVVMACPGGERTLRSP